MIIDGLTLTHCSRSLRLLTYSIATLFQDDELRKNIAAHFLYGIQIHTIRVKRQRDICHMFRYVYVQDSYTNY